MFGTNKETQGLFVGDKQVLKVYNGTNLIYEYSQGGESVSQFLTKYADGTLTEVRASDLSGLTRLGMGAFSTLESLTTIELPEGLTTIDHNVFRDGNIVTLPSTLTSMGCQQPSYTTGSWGDVKGTYYYNGTKDDFDTKVTCPDYHAVSSGSGMGSYYDGTTNFLERGKNKLYVLDANGDVTYNNKTYKKYADYEVTE